ncbi:MAG: tripartite tricarboxylate transporter substrate binding protein [Betaproteobacteria bacterium]|nr:tripartite tricarboxylate transporter substrate binding protein [Betaproteobacteria bacterium]
MKISALLFFVALLAGTAFLPATGDAQTYPEKPVRVVVPFPAGGAADIVARHVAQKLGEAFGAQLIVDNRAGAGGAIGAEHVMRAAADGYTLLFASSSVLSINPHLSAKSSYDPLRSFTPVILVGHAPNVLVVHPSVPAKSVRELIALAKKQPDALAFASNGAGTLSHLTGELFMQRAGIRMLHVPYKGAAPAVIDTIAGNVSVLFAAYPSVSAQERAGKLKALAVTSAKRVAIAPQLPTVAEAALPGFESSQWWGLYGPAGMPAGIVTRLNTELNKIFRTPEIRQRLAADGAEPAGGTPAGLAAYHRADYDKWGKVIGAAGLRRN